MRAHVVAMLIATVLIPSVVRAGDDTSRPVFRISSENGLHRTMILGEVVSQDGYPRGSLIADESEERLGIATERDSEEPAAESSSDHALLRRKVAELDQLQTEVDQLRASMGTPQQIVVHVQMLEVSHTKLRKLGIDFAEFSDAGFTQANLADLMAQGQPQKLPSHVSAEFIDFLKQNNIAKVLADPTLVTTSGRPASFLVGGQFPMPAARGSASAVEYREFGTSVEVLAVALGNHRVRLEVRPRISEVDDSRAIEIEGQRVPALRVRQCDSVCEMTFGETIALGGMMQERIESAKSSDGRVAESVNEIATWVVVRAEKAGPIDLNAR